MESTQAGMLAEKMDRHLDEYLLFYSLCRAKKHIDEEEVPMLWRTWVISEAL